MIKKHSLVVFVLPLLLALTGCEQDVKIDPEFSVNIFRPGPKWPTVKKLTLAQKEAYDKFGRPDAFRVWWGPKGELKDRDAAIQEFKQKKMKNPPPYSWVYLARNTELVFTGSGYEERPISDQVRVLVKMGDPEDVKELQTGVTQWMFYSTGKLYKFMDGRIVEEKDFPAMGNFPKN